MTDSQIDQALDAILRAAGSGLKNYTMEKSRKDMRSAFRDALEIMGKLKSDGNPNQ